MEITKAKTCCIIGNKIIRPDVQIKTSLLINSIIKVGYTHFITGAGRAFDNFAALYVLNAKKKYPHITLEVAIPYENQRERWNIIQKMICADIMLRADMVTYISPTYSKRGTEKRNKYMIDNSSMLFVQYDDKRMSDGVKSAIDYANRKEICVISPELFFADTCC